MAIKVTVTVVLGDGWITDEEAEAPDVTDAYLRELIDEDPVAFLEEATFTFERNV